MKKIINGIESEMTAEELTAFENKQAEQQAYISMKLLEEKDKQNAKASGYAKLLAMGLTQEEATAMTGYKPIEEKI